MRRDRGIPSEVKGEYYRCLLTSCPPLCLSRRFLSASASSFRRRPCLEMVAVHRRRTHKHAKKVEWHAAPAHKYPSSSSIPAICHPSFQITDDALCSAHHFTRRTRCTSCSTIELHSREDLMVHSVMRSVTPTFITSIITAEL